jgi:hypothetical protein
MQKWEYAHIVWNRGPNEWMELDYLHPAGYETEQLRAEKGLFAKDTDFWGRLNFWVTKLGQEGYEMTGATAYSGTLYPYYVYWFKRPIT